MTPDGTIPPFIAYTLCASVSALVAAAGLLVWATARRQR